MSPTPRVAVVLGGAALAALVLGPVAAVLVGVALVAALVVDARVIRRAPAVRRRVASIVSRGVAVPYSAGVGDDGAVRHRLRQGMPPGVALGVDEAEGGIDTSLVASRRGRHVLPAVAVRSSGPLGLATWDHAVGGSHEVSAYPDIVAAQRLAAAVRTGRLAESGLRRRGPLGLGTEFERVRDYLPDDDARQINWRATARLGRPMSNEDRVERDRDVLLVVDTGRLMGSPAGGRTRLDAALDAAAAVALVADELGDRCGTLAFDSEVRRRMAPRRSGGSAAIRLLFDLEPRSVDSDYELAFRNVREAKRAWVLVLTDLLEEAAARPLVAAVPVLSRGHVLAVAGVRDPDVGAASSTVPKTASEAYEAAAALEFVAARDRAAAQVRAAGADVIEASPDRLAAVCVGAYLRAKARALL